MHQTSTTQLSDLIITLKQLDTKLNQASFTPVEELLGILVAGSIVLNSMAEKTTKAQFTDEEVSFIESLVDRIEENLEEIYTNQQEDQRDSYGDSDDDHYGDFNENENRNGWKYPEWDN